MNFLRFIQEIFHYEPNSPMIFNSGMFMLLFIILIIIYSLIHKNKLAVTLFVIAFSLLFYYKSSGWYFLLLVFATFSNYLLAFLINRSKRLLSKKLLLVCSLILSLGLLAYFKYTNFILGNIYEIMGRNFQPLDIFLPIGISFFTFQGLSYVLDIYYKRMEPVNNILDFSFYLTFFPLLLAGPIMKAHDFIPQIKKGPAVNKESVYSGLWLIMSGLIKKAIIADYIGLYNNLIFAAPDSYSGFEILAAILGYTLQIYCDFSGYSDMAIGIARIMGFDLGINFNFPYKSRNITEFWQRWHISLTSWFREYLFLPIAYAFSNKMKKMKYLGIKTEIWIYLVASMVTFLLCGLWHGPEWKFILWGGMHGVALVIHRALKKFLKKRVPDNLATTFFSWLITFSFVVFLWVFFRATDVTKEVVTIQKINNTEKQVVKTETTKAFDVAWHMAKKAVTELDLSYAKPFWDRRTAWVILVLIGFAMHAFPEKWTQKLASFFIKSPFAVKLFAFIILVQLVIQFQSEDIQPFIYFQF